jgi:hypothetical protein
MNCSELAVHGNYYRNRECFERSVRSRPDDKVETLELFNPCSLYLYWLEGSVGLDKVDP